MTEREAAGEARMVEAVAVAVRVEWPMTVKRALYGGGLAISSRWGLECCVSEGCS